MRVFLFSASLCATAAAVACPVSFAMDIGIKSAIEMSTAHYFVAEATRSAQVQRGTRSALRHANTVWGSTGLIFIPTAYTADRDVFDISAGLSKDFATGSVSYGIISDIEIGGAYIDRTDAENEFIANAKVTILPSNFNWLELGVGIMDAADAINQSIYVVGSVDLINPPATAERGSIGLRVHGGAGTGYFSEKLFGGAELRFNNGLSLIGEWDTKNANFAVRYAHNNEFFVDLGSYASRPMFKLTYNLRLNSPN